MNEVRDIPWGGVDLRCAEHQAEICVLSAPARDRSRRVIDGLGNIHSDGVSWECSSVTCIDLGSLAGNVAPSPAAGQNRRTVRACQGSLSFWEVAKHSSQAHVGNPDLPGGTLLEPASGSVLGRKPAGPAYRRAVTFVRVKLAQIEANLYV